MCSSPQHTHPIWTPSRCTCTLSTNKVCTYFQHAPLYNGHVWFSPHQNTHIHAPFIVQSIGWNWRPDQQGLYFYLRKKCVLTLLAPLPVSIFLSHVQTNNTMSWLAYLPCSFCYFYFLPWPRQCFGGVAVRALKSARVTRWTIIIIVILPFLSLSMATTWWPFERVNNDISNNGQINHLEHFQIGYQNDCLSWGNMSEHPLLGLCHVSWFTHKCQDVRNGYWTHQSYHCLHGWNLLCLRTSGHPYLQRWSLLLLRTWGLYFFQSQWMILSAPIAALHLWGEGTMMTK